MARISLQQRFDKKYIPVPESGCWIWLAAMYPEGYGYIKINGKGRGAHRVSWILVNGSIPKGMSVLHTCDVRCCVNPAHLFLGTHQDNMTDMSAKSRSLQGEKSPRAKLTDSDVRHIRDAYQNQGKTYSELSRAYGVSGYCIFGVVTKKTWRHLP